MNRGFAGIVLAGVMLAGCGGGYSDVFGGHASQTLGSAQAKANAVAQIADRIGLAHPDASDIASINGTTGDSKCQYPSGLARNQNEALVDYGLENPALLFVEVSVYCPSLL
jgi:hypothetical protein